MAYALRWLKAPAIWSRRMSGRRPPNIAQDMEIFLIFTPEGNRTFHLVMNFIANVLKEQGFAPYIANCFDNLDRCQVKANHALKPHELEIDVCLKCAKRRSKIIRKSGIPTLELGWVFDESIQRTVAMALSNPPDDLRDLTFDGINFGKLSVTSFVLETKRSNFASVSAEHRKIWLGLIETCLGAYLAIDRLCRTMQISGIGYFNDYAINLGVRLAAERHDVPCYFVSLSSHRNLDWQRVIVSPNSIMTYSQQIVADWSKWAHLPLAPSQVAEVADDMIFRTSGSGSHIYSKPLDPKVRDVRGALSLDPDRKLLVAYTSSLDEQLAALHVFGAIGCEVERGPQPFSDQIEWLSQLCRFVADDDNLQLVVRVHPREGVNHREAFASEHLEKLKVAFSKPPPRCQFVWPDEDVSSYSLGHAADLVLISWSLIGSEFARFGVPVLMAFDCPDAKYPIGEFLRWKSTASDYFEELYRMLDQPNGYEGVKAAFRWYSLLNFANAIDISDVVPRSGLTAEQEYVTPRRADDFRRVFRGETTPLEISYEDACRRNSESEVIAEADSLIGQFRRLIHYLCTGVDCVDQIPEIVVVPRHPPAGLRAEGRNQISVEGTNVVYEMPSGVFMHNSVMIARMCRLLEEMTSTSDRREMARG